MYKALVRSNLDYYDTIYHIPASDSQINLGVTLNSLREKVERIQYHAALVITGTWHGTNRSKLYEELGWETLSDRRWCRRILQIHKIEKYKTPSYLTDKLPPHRRPFLITIIHFKKYGWGGGWGGGGVPATPMKTYVGNMIFGTQVYMIVPY